MTKSLSYVPKLEQGLHSPIDRTEDVPRGRRTTPPSRCRTSRPPGAPADRALPSMSGPATPLATPGAVLRYTAAAPPSPPPVLPVPGSTGWLSAWTPAWAEPSMSSSALACLRPSPARSTTDNFGDGPVRYTVKPTFNSAGMP